MEEAERQRTGTKRRGKEPAPPSEVPSLRDSTMVFPLPQSQVGFPNIPNVTYTGLKTTRYRFNYGPGYYDNGPNGGIPSTACTACSSNARCICTWSRAAIVSAS